MTLPILPAALTTRPQLLTLANHIRGNPPSGANGPAAHDVALAERYQSAWLAAFEGSFVPGSAPWTATDDTDLLAAFEYSNRLKAMLGGGQVGHGGLLPAIQLLIKNQLQPLQSRIEQLSEQLQQTEERLSRKLASSTSFAGSGGFDFSFGQPHSGPVVLSQQAAVAMHQNSSAGPSSTPIRHSYDRESSAMPPPHSGSSGSNSFALPPIHPRHSSSLFDDIHTLSDTRSTSMPPSQSDTTPGGSRRPRVCLFHNQFDIPEPPGGCKGRGGVLHCSEAKSNPALLEQWNALPANTKRRRKD